MPPTSSPVPHAKNATPIKRKPAHNGDSGSNSNSNTTNNNANNNHSNSINIIGGSHKVEDKLKKVRKQRLQKNGANHQQWLTPGRGVAIVLGVVAILFGIVLSMPPTPPNLMFPPHEEVPPDAETKAIQAMLVERETLIQAQREGRRLNEHVERDIGKFIEEAKQKLRKEAAGQSTPSSTSDANDHGEVERQRMLERFQQQHSQKQREEMMLTACQVLVDRTTELVLSTNMTSLLHVVNEMGDIVDKAQHCHGQVQFEIYEDLADFCTHMHFYNLAVPARKLILKLPISVKERMLQQTSLATDLYYDHKYDEALETITDTLEEYDDDFPTDAKRMLLFLQAQAYECKGDLITSLHFVETASSVDSSPPPIQLMLFHYDLLLRVKENEDVPENIAQTISHRLHHIGSILLRVGPWTDFIQLPAHYVPGLLALPWHEFRRHTDLAKFEVLLEMHHKSLAAELEDLIRNKLLSAERECIHEIQGGNWFRYEIHGYWHPLDERTNCSIETPTACAVVESMKAAGLRVIRAGYSAVDAHTVLKPHFGSTNAQLKFHLGLHIPTNEDGSSCAFLKVGHETRAWGTGKVLFFDDSFRHSVVNRCETIRSLFQVVFVHPDLQDEKTINKHFYQAGMADIAESH
eukprot:m.26811 g.26811  ORF g.26811 m.26811 type:complete len:635 (-) comp5890_c0_seq1:81-1985(-)